MVSPTLGVGVVRNCVRSLCGQTYRRFPKLFVTLVSLAFVSCDSSTGISGVDENAGPDLSLASIEAVQGDAQEAEVGSLAPAPLVVRVRDQDGNAFAGAPVEWTFTQGLGRTNQASGTAAQVVRTMTNAQGLSEIRWELGHKAGVQQVTAEVVAPSSMPAATGGPSGAPGNGNGKRVGFTAKATPGSTDEIVIAPSPLSATVGDTVQLEAAVIDKWGNELEGVALQWLSSNQSVARVDDSGLVTTLDDGAAEVTASDGSVEGMTEVTVMAEDQTEPHVPATVDDLRVGETTETTVTVRWTEVTDGSGGAADYALRIGSPTIAWGPAGESEVTVAGSSVGGTLEYTWTDLLPGTDYEVQLVAYRGTPGVDAVFGELSNVASGATGASDDPVALELETSSLPSGTEGVAYSETLSAGGGDGAYAWSVGSGALPEGLNLGESSGTISGTPTTVGTFAFTVLVTSGDGQGDSGTFSIVIAEAPSGSDPGLANECDAQSPAWIWCDDFDENRLASYFEVNDAGGSFTREAAVGVDGSYAMEGAFEAGQTNAGDLKLAFGSNGAQSYAQPVDGGVLEYRDVYWRMFVRTEAGWTGGGGDKLSRGMVLANESWGQAAIGHVWTPSGGANLMIEPVRGTDEAGNLLATTYNDFSNFAWLGSAQGTTQLFSDANANRWFCVEAHMRLNDAGLSNGEFEFWVDGNTEARRTGLNWLGAYDAHGINAIFFENFWNEGSPATQSRYFDNIVVSTERIGCNGGTPGGSNPVAVVEVSGGSNVEAGSTLNLTATAKDKTNAVVSDAAITWTSSNSGVATIDAMTGTVTGISQGTATVIAESSNGKRGSVLVSVTTGDEAAPLSVTTTALPDGTEGEPYNESLSAAGGDGNYVWSVTSGALPSGLSLSASGGTISGTPTVPGDFSFRVAVTDGGGATDSRSLALKVIPVGDAVPDPDVTPLIVEDFSTYSSTSNMLSDPRGLYVSYEDQGTNRMALDTNVGYGSSDRSMRYEWSNSGGTVTRWLELNDLQEVWVEWTVRFDEDFTIEGGGGGGSAWKFLHVNQPSVSGRFGVNFENGDNGTLGIEVPNDAYDAGYQASGSYGIADHFLDGEWHTLRYHVRLPNLHELWVDGELVARQNDFQTSASSLYGVSLGKNMNQTIAGPQHMWWGKVLVYDRDPSW
ncbi:MAG: putative Ig domain-containing protein [Dehalococcoidia bacterium]